MDDSVSEKYAGLEGGEGISPDPRPLQRLSRGSGDPFDPIVFETVTPVRTTRSKFSCPNFRDPLEVRILVVLIMQVATLIAFITQAVIFFRDLQWNSVLEGSTTVSFPTPHSTWIDRYINWNDKRLKVLLVRNLTLPVIGALLLATMFILHLLAQIFDWQNLCLGTSSMMTGAFGMALFIVGVCQILWTVRSTLQKYDAAADALLELVALDDDVYPYSFPPGNPISVRTYPHYFLQIAKSCQQGGVEEWEVKSDLMGITAEQIKIPSYRQIRRMGFCVDADLKYSSILFMFIIVMLAGTNVTLSMTIRKMELMSNRRFLEEMKKFEEVEAELKFGQAEEDDEDDDDEDDD